MTAPQRDHRDLDLDEVEAAISKKTIRRRRPTRPRGGPSFYTAAEAAELLRTSTVTIYRAVKEGELQGFKIRGRVIVPARAIEALANVVADEEATAAFLRERA
jgi:excisionase family DNA binding protein